MPLEKILHFVTSKCSLLLYVYKNSEHNRLSYGSYIYSVFIFKLQLNSIVFQYQNFINGITYTDRALNTPGNFNGLCRLIFF